MNQQFIQLQIDQLREELQARKDHDEEINKRLGKLERAVYFGTGFCAALQILGFFAHH